MSATLRPVTKQSTGLQQAFSVRADSAVEALDLICKQRGWTAESASLMVAPMETVLQVDGTNTIRIATHS